MQVQVMGGGHALELVVCLRDSVVQVHHQRKLGDVIVGSAPACQVMVPAEVLGGAQARVLAGLDAAGAWCVESLDAGAARKRLVAGQGMTFSHGELRLFVRLVEDQGQRIPVALKPDGKLAAALAGAVAFVLVTLGLAYAVAPNADALTAMDIWQDRQATLVRIKANEDALREKEQAAEASGNPGEQGESAAGSGAAGKMGTPDSHQKARTAIKGTRAFDKPGAHDARAIADHAGPLGAFAANDFSQITGTDDEWGSAEQHGYGSDLTADIGNGEGTWGHGFQGDKTGSCPPGVPADRCKNGIYGSGDYGDHMTGGPGGPLPGGDKGLGGPRVGDHTPKAPPKIGPPTVDCGDDGEECVDLAALKRIIRQKKDAIGYCFDRELQMGRASGGSMGVSFMISTNGTVSGVRMSSDAGVSAAEGCVADVLSGLKFPALARPITVKYPFTFHSR